MLERAVAGAAVLSVLSEAAAVPVRAYLRRDPEIVPGGVDLEAFGVDAERAPVPTVVCAAGLADPRKRAGLLLAGFARLRETVPDARLVLAGGSGMESHGDEPDLTGPGVERIAPDGTAGLARALASAWVSALPSAEEAFGLVLVESLAAGTPAVADRSGAGPEILGEDGTVGSLFDGADPGALATALSTGLDLAGDPEARERCRERAARFDVSVVAERWEELYPATVCPPAHLGSGT